MTDSIIPNDIANVIIKQGYVVVEPLEVVKPSFYRLVDGTVMSAVIDVHGLLPHQTPDGEFYLNSTKTVMCYTDVEKRNPALYDPDAMSNPELYIVEEDMELEILREVFSFYKLSNGRMLGVKPVVAQVSKTSLYNNIGEPVYLVKITPIIKDKWNQN